MLRLEWRGAAPEPGIDPTGRGVWRYRPLLPTVGASSIVTLGEGATPIVWIGRWAAAHRLDRVGVKLEYLNPTGSFKDRGMTVLVSHACSLGLGRLIEDSSGNAGASVAAYAARAGLEVTIYVPSGAPAAKRAQIARVGATVVPIEGSRQAVTQAALAEVAHSGAYYAGHNANPFFVAGMTTFAYELIEELAGSPPRHLVIPTGGGSLCVGCFDGFRRWFGEAEGERRCPKIHAIQSSACAPLVAAFERGLDRVPPIARRKTIAGGIEVERPPRDHEILQAIRRTEGSAVAVDDAEILSQRRLLAETEGIDVEPTTAAAFAGLARLAKTGVIAPDELVIVAATGAGWKDPG
ncbi:MAG: pyridoxal-phosphate dependent enzyme [Chloroflexota bacterium]